MKTMRYLLTVAVASFLCFSLYSGVLFAQSLRTKLLENAGKTFTGVEDPAYQSYDRVLRDYVAKRINKRYGVAVDPKVYTGFELLEIEAFLKCKKSGETLTPFLEKFQKK